MEDSWRSKTVRNYRITDRNEIPDGQPSLTANRRECADMTPVSGKTTFPDGWPTGIFSRREFLTDNGRACLVEYLMAARQEHVVLAVRKSIMSSKKITHAELHTSNSVCMLVPYTCPSYT